MAVTASGLFVATFADILDTTQLAIDLDLETHKGALFNNTLTPNFTTDTAYAVAPYNANEVTGTNWASGGVVLTGTTIAANAGTVVFDATDVSVANTTLYAVRAYFLYADVLVGNNAILLVDLLQDYATINGTFAITWAGGGIAIIDLTP